jgi:hypothetical protein
LKKIKGAKICLLRACCVIFDFNEKSTKKLNNDLLYKGVTQQKHHGSTEAGNKKNMQ